MARCGCSETAASGCQCGVESSDCITVSGSGAAGDPFIIEPILDPDADNIIECTANGLRAIIDDTLTRSPVAGFATEAQQGLTASFAQYGALSVTIVLPGPGSYIVNVEWTATLNVTISGAKLQARLVEDGSPVGWTASYSDNAGTGGATVGNPWQTTKAAGSYQYDVEIQRQSGSGGTSENGTLRVTAIPA